MNSFEQQSCDRSNNKTGIFARWGDNGDDHIDLSQQPTTTDDANQPNDIIKVSIASFISVDCCLLFRFSNLIEMAPQWPW
jgi:hypothetical protein